MSVEPIRFSRQRARFDHADRYDRGSRYNDRHLQDVDVETLSANEFVVRFPDSDDAHRVDLEANEGEYVGSCTCGDFEYRDVVCKHIWAVLADSTTFVLEGSDRHRQYNEIAVADRLDLELVDETNFDAIATEETNKLDAGAKFQIKGAQEKIRNGYDEKGNQQYTAGRLTLWREELLNLLADGGKYAVAVYDSDTHFSDPGFLTRWRIMTPEEIGEVADGSWYDGHRPGKGERAKVSWRKVLGSDPDV